MFPKFLFVYSQGSMNKKILRKLEFDGCFLSQAKNCSVGLVNKDK